MLVKSESSKGMVTSSIRGSLMLSGDNGTGAFGGSLRFSVGWCIDFLGGSLGFSIVKSDVDK